MRPEKFSGWPWVRCPPMRQRHAQHCIAWFQRGHIHRHVGRCPGVRLHVGVIRSEKLLGTVDGQLLDLVRNFAAAVVALARIALRVLFRKDRPHRLQHGLGDEISEGISSSPVAWRTAFFGGAGPAIAGQRCRGDAACGRLLRWSFASPERNARAYERNYGWSKDRLLHESNGECNWPQRARISSIRGNKPWNRPVLIVLDGLVSRRRSILNLLSRYSKFTLLRQIMANIYADQLSEYWTNSPDQAEPRHRWRQSHRAREDRGEKPSVLSEVSHRAQ